MTVCNCQKDVADASSFELSCGKLKLEAVSSTSAAQGAVYDQDSGLDIVHLHCAVQTCSTGPLQLPMPCK